MLGVMILAALAVDLVFSDLGLTPHIRPSIASITDRGVTFNYTAVLNILFTMVAAALAWLTLRRGAKDPVWRMRVDRYKTPHKLVFEGREFVFCTAACREEFATKPDHYAYHAHGDAGWTPARLAEVARLTECSSHAVDECSSPAVGSY